MTDDDFARERQIRQWDKMAKLSENAELKNSPQLQRRVVLRQLDRARDGLREALAEICRSDRLGLTIVEHERLVARLRALLPPEGEH